MKDYIQIGIEKGLISFNEDKTRIKYKFQEKERNYNNPEEKVQSEARFAIGDVVYLFMSDERRIRFKMVVTAENVEREDLAFWVEKASSDTTYRFELLEEYDGGSSFRTGNVQAWFQGWKIIGDSEL